MMLAVRNQRQVHRDEVEPTIGVISAQLLAKRYPLSFGETLHKSEGLHEVEQTT